MIDNKDIGLRIRKGREKLALSRQDFAELVALSDYYIGQLERGERQMSLNVLIKIASCLHLSLDYLIFGNSQLGYVQEDLTTYVANVDHNDTELNYLLSRCSTEEKELIIKLIKTIIPYMGKR